ncbi:MAG: hypothetical protein RRC34_01990 [Lentisphaeria bacterium]|nr:hypothetical protein [Lentisphaeria bacterium]
MRHLITCVTVSILYAAVMNHADGLDIVGETTAVTHEKSGLTVLKGRVLLPSRGEWYAAPGKPADSAFRQLVLLPPEDLHDKQLGERAKEIQRQRRLRDSRYAITAFWWPLLSHARDHEGDLPADLHDPALKPSQHFQNTLNKSAYPKHPGRPPAPYYALLKDVKIIFKKNDRHPDYLWPENSAPMVVELHPLLDDGLHWVLHTDGTAKRVNIDHQLMAANRLEITPFHHEETSPRRDDRVAYSVYALAAPGKNETFHIINSETEERRDCQWRTADAGNGQPEDIATWAESMVDWWSGLAIDYDAPIYKNWTEMYVSLFDLSNDNTGGSGRRNNRGATTDMFNVLGGRAAMRETLQLQALSLNEKTHHGKPPVALADIHGVQVKSHPFTEMLGNDPGGRLAIADCVPVDRFFLHIADPAALTPLLGGGSEFISKVGAGALGRALDYDLQDRYFARLGVTRDWLKQLLESGLVKEIAVTAPDLFFVDGTDVTAIVHVSNTRLLTPLLTILGMNEVKEGAPRSIKTASGHTAYWAVADGKIIASTRSRELERVMEKIAAKGADSLGQSDEFKYMLTQLPETENTTVYAYFSDPFIRRLVGPDVKIAQLRRLRETAKLHAVTAAALLWRAQGREGVPTVDTLVAKGYLPDTADYSGISLEENLVARSETNGVLADPGTLADHPVDQATAAEAAAYKMYVDNYARFWRRFFDPIAIRIDQTGDRDFDVETFILPLIDNSLYNGLKDVVGGGEHAPPIRIPQISPAPVALLSLNLSEKVWVDFLGDVLDEFVHNDPDILAAVDDLGPAVHVAIHDSDPIIAFGSGELLGMGGNLRGFNDDMLGIPLMISLLTRPTTIIVELRDEEAVRRVLKDGYLADILPFGGDVGAVDYYRIRGKDAWVCGFSFFGISLRFQLEIQNSYLMISNLPWGPDINLGVSAAPDLVQAELSLNPAAAEHQLAAMFTAAQERQRHIAMEGIACLAPLIEEGNSVTEAVTIHRRLFGFTPVHPDGGMWIVKDGELESSVYGAPFLKQQPAHTAGDRRFGLLQGVGTVRVGARFEDDGLRARVRWSFDR